MVMINYGSLTSPLLGDHNENIQNFCSIGSHRDEVVVVIPREIEDGIIPNESLTNQSKNTFQQTHALNQICSNDYSRCELGHRGQSKQKKPLVGRANYSTETNSWSFLYNLMVGLFMWPKWSWNAMKKNSNLTILSIKQGLCAGLCSIPCVVKIPEPFTVVSTIALWAVITIDLLYEGNIGLSINKGFNRVLGTLFAGCLGFGLNQLGLQLGAMYPYFVVFCVIMGGFIFRFLKGIPPLKEQWGYAFTVATIAFHFFIIFGYLYPERWTLPMLRFLMISFGFAMSSIINLLFQPIYAGDTLHKLVVEKFEIAANVFERCIEEYIKDTKLDHVLDTLSGQCEDNKIHQSSYKIVVSDSDIDKLVSIVELLRQLVMSNIDMEKLLSIVLWEPPHGNFFIGYPWHLYNDIVDCLCDTLHDVIALDLCLHTSIQAPKHLRDIFAQEMATIATECANVLRILGDSMKNMKKFSSENIMTQAEEAVVQLQSKIHQNTKVLLENTTESEHYTLEERISALSLVKFVSLFIEVVSKMRVVVDCVEDFSEQAKFQVDSN